MRPEEALTPSEQELARALAGLRPASKGIDRNRLMFEAGRRSMRRRVFAWRAVSLFLCIGFGVAWFDRPAPRPAERIEYVMVHTVWPVQASSLRTPVGKGYFQLQERVLREGLDVLSVDRTGSVRKLPEPLTVDELVSEMTSGI